MDNNLIFAVVAIFGVFGILGISFAKLSNRQGKTLEKFQERIVDLSNKLVVSQQEMEERLKGEQRHLSEKLTEQRIALNKTLSEGLQDTTKKTLETMSKVESRLAVIDKAQSNITELSSQFVSLQDILSNKQARGAFGEIQLNDIVSQVLPPSAYTFQAQLENGKRADCLLELPNPPGAIVIDAKFPLESYHALQETSHDAMKKTAIRAFREAMQKHIKDIADKYILPGKTADAALMFLPSEAVYAELHTNFSSVIESSYRARVFIVSPTTLWATLNTVRAVLKDVRMKHQAGIIQVEVQALFEDVLRLDDRVGKLQRHFDQTTEDLRQIRISTDKIGKRAERIETVQVEQAPNDDIKIVSPTYQNDSDKIGRADS